MGYDPVDLYVDGSQVYCWNLRLAKRFQGGEDHWLVANIPYDPTQSHGDIAFNKQVQAKIGATEVWRGRIRKIESHKEPEAYMTVRCFGEWIYLDDFSYGGEGRLWSQKDFRRWRVGTKKGQTYTIDKQVAASGDDGHRYSAYGPPYFSSTEAYGYLGLVANGAPFVHHGFARWTGVTIAGTIDVAYIKYYAHAAGVGSPLLKVYGVDQDNPAAPTTYQEFDDDPLTSAAIDWDDAWTINTWEQSPSLVSIFQELVDTYTIENEAVMVQIKDDGSGSNNYNTPRFWDYAGNLHGPKLYIEYTIGDFPSRAPSRYQMDTHDRLFIAPKKDHDFDDTHIGSLYFYCPYGTVKDVKFSYKFNMAAGWRFRIRGYTADWVFNEELMYLDGTGSAQNANNQIYGFSTDKESEIIVVDLFYNSGTPITHTGQTGMKRLKFTKFELYGWSDAPDYDVTITDIGKDIVDQINADTPLSSAYTLIETISNPLEEPLVFEKGEMCLDALKIAAKEGDANKKMVGYGVESGGNRVYVRDVDWVTAKYSINPDDARRIFREAAMKGGRKGYLSEAWGKYQDRKGYIRFTEKYYVHTDGITTTVNTTGTGADLASTRWFKRSGVIDCGNVRKNRAEKIVQAELHKRGHPILGSSIDIIHVINESGVGDIHPIKIEPGHLCSIEAFPDPQWTANFLISGFEWDEENGRCRIFAEYPEDSPRQILARVRQMEDRL